MTYLSPTEDISAAVLQLETTTPALGGPGGVMNQQAQALLNRVEWLKNNKLNTSQATAAGLALLGATDVAAQRSALGLANHQLVTVDGGGSASVTQNLTVTAQHWPTIKFSNTTTGATYTLGAANALANGFDGFGLFDGAGYAMSFRSGRWLLNKTVDDGVNQFQCNGSGEFSGNLSSTGFTQIVGDFGSNAFDHSALYLSPDSAYGARFIGGIRQGEGGELQLQIRNNGAHTTVLRVPSSGVVHAVRGLIVPDCADDAAAAAANIPVGAIYRTGTTLKVRAA